MKYNGLAYIFVTRKEDIPPYTEDSKFAKALRKESQKQ